MTYAAGVLVLHTLGILLLLSSLPSHPTLLGLGFLAYSFGLRHAFDADHIAAIDNTVRKFKEDRTDSMGVGFFFSLGHSTVVCVMAVITAIAIHWAQQSLPVLQAIGGIVGTIASVTFLVIIGLVNLAVLINLSRTFAQMRHGVLDTRQLEMSLQARGLIFRFVSPLIRVVRRSWHMYPIGVLFGLGFDTASEIALLAMSGGTARNAVPFAGMMALPVLFAAAMSLMDTADGLFMSNAYGWALATPIRKVYYNLTVTSLSVVAALFVALIEVVQVVTPVFGTTQSRWSSLLHVPFSMMGIGLVSLFVVAWVVSYCTWKFSKIEQRWSASVD